MLILCKVTFRQFTLHLQTSQIIFHSPGDMGPWGQKVQICASFKVVFIRESSGQAVKCGGGPNSNPQCNYLLYTVKTHQQSKTSHCTPLCDIYHSHRAQPAVTVTVTVNLYWLGYGNNFFASSSTT